MNYTELLTPLTHRLYNKEKIESRSRGYADDVGVLLNRSESDLQNLEKVLEDFGKLSGLKLNKNKTELCPINFKWEDDIYLRAATLKTGFKLGENKINLLGSIIFLDRQDET